MAATGKIRVFIVDDHAILRSSLKALLRSEKDIEVVGEAGGVDGLIQAVQDAAPDVILMDISLGDGEPDGIEATRMVREAYPSAKVLILTMHDDDEYLPHAAKAGAAGYVLKAAEADELIQAIRVAASGGGFLSPKVAKQALDQIAKQADRVHEQSREELIAELGLTDQELEVLELMVQGYRYEEIARRLFLSKSRIKQAASSICRKLKARDKAHACALAVHLGLVTELPRQGSGPEAVDEEDEEI